MSPDVRLPRSAGVSARCPRSRVTQTFTGGAPKGRDCESRILAKNVNHFTFGQPGPAHRLDRNTVVSNKKGGPGDTLPSIDNGGRDIRHVCALSGRLSSRAWP